MAVEVATARRRIIRRPRLTSILDESSTRVRMLVAPAGYGKTTLAREWLGEDERNDVWYRGGPASADVAALAVGIAEAASQVIPDAGSRMRDRLRATGHPQEDVEILAELFAADVQEWPSDAWLAFDDYHFAMGSVASERFVDLLTQQTSMQLLITSRRRPSWATARRILYGEILEIDRRALAMDDTEAREVLGREDPSTDEVIARAGGWPAVLGLAAVAATLEVRGDALPETLHDYFAEELVQAVTPETQTGLRELAAVPGAVSHDLATKVLGPQAGEILEDALRVGALTYRGGEFELHPLLRDFMMAGALERGREYVQQLAERVVNVLVGERRWDDAFYVVRTLRAPALLSQLLAVALEDLLRDGRIQTLSQWLDFYSATHIPSPIVDLAEAEVAFRQGDYARAEALALASSHALANDDLKASALIRAGQAALLGSRDERALCAYRAARKYANTQPTRLEAIVGEGFAVSELGLADEAKDVLKELDRLPEGGFEMRIRRAMLDLVHAVRFGGVTRALDSGKDNLSFLDKVKSPLVVSSFRNAYAHLLVLAARYDEAEQLSEKQLQFARDYRLDFVLPHTYLLRASAESGMRNFGRALDLIEAAEQEAGGDVHISMNAAARRARIAIERHDFESAATSLVDQWEQAASASMRAELLAYRALAATCLGDFEASDRLASQIRAIRGSGVEATALGACCSGIRAVVEERPRANDLAVESFRTAESLGAVDCFVTAARSAPLFLAAVLSDARCAASASALLARSNDSKLARSVGLTLVPTASGELSALTPREMEVSRLVARGHTNRAIGERLYISETTVKVHVRHALEKLGARSRAELAARIAAADDVGA